MALNILFAALFIIATLSITGVIIYILIVIRQWNIDKIQSTKTIVMDGALCQKDENGNVLIKKKGDSTSAAILVFGMLGIFAFLCLMFAGLFARSTPTIKPWHIIAGLLASSIFLVARKISLIEKRKMPSANFSVDTGILILKRGTLLREIPLSSVYHIVAQPKPHPFTTLLELGDGILDILFGAPATSLSHVDNPIPIDVDVILNTDERITIGRLSGKLAQERAARIIELAMETKHSAILRSGGFANASYAWQSNTMKGLNR